MGSRRQTLGTGANHSRRLTGYCPKLWQQSISGVELRSRIVKPEAMSRVTVYSTASCPICVHAKTMLGKWEIAFDEIMIDADNAAFKEFARVTNGARTVPQILIDGKPIGGFSELTELHMDGDLDELMQQD